MDSLLDVFMNVLGVLMITAVVLALVVRDQKGMAPTAGAPLPETPTARPDRLPPTPPIVLTLPQAEEASTIPLYLLITEEGIRAANGDDPSVPERYFYVASHPYIDSRILDGIPGEVMTKEDLQTWLRIHSQDSRHLMALITPDGASYYNEVRQLATQEGFRVGWLPHQGNRVILGSGGRDGRTVQ